MSKKQNADEPLQPLTLVQLHTDQDDQRRTPGRTRLTPFVGIVSHADPVSQAAGYYRYCVIILKDEWNRLAGRNTPMLYETVNAYTGEVTPLRQLTELEFSQMVAG